MKPIVTWILIADSTRARVLVNSGPGQGIREVEGQQFVRPHRTNQDIMSDRPGRGFKSGSQHRFAMDYPTDPQTHEEKNFARDVVQSLVQDAGQYDRLIIVAAPKTLGHIRQALPDQLSGKLHAEIPKDLAGLPDPQIADHLADVITI